MSRLILRKRSDSAFVVNNQSYPKASTPLERSTPFATTSLKLRKATEGGIVYGGNACTKKKVKKVDVNNERVVSYEL